MNFTPASSWRILVCDPDMGHHQRVKDILLGSANGQLRIKAVPPGHPNRPLSPPRYDIDSATDRESALRMVNAAVEENNPFELAVVAVTSQDARRWVEMIQQMWILNHDMQILLCVEPSAPQPWDICTALGNAEQLIVLHQPYRDIELSLLALNLGQKCRLQKQLAETLQRQSEHYRDASRVVEIIYECERELANSRDDLQVQTSKLSNQLRQRVDEILGTRDVMVFALERIAESRDAETGEHLERLRAYSQILAEELAENGPYSDQIDGEFLRNFALSTPLHDIGKVGVPDCILRKPARLEIDEFDIMKQHTLIGAEALRAAAEQSIYGEFLLMAAEIARSHHERFDGTGYPDGLAGTDIPLSARIVAVADVFDALTSRRVYKDAHESQDAREAILREAGTHFDPHVVAAFERRYEDFLRVKNDNISFGTQNQLLDV